MFKKNYLNLSLCLAILIFMTVACDGGSHIKGYVYDAEGKPIVNAVVKFEDAEKKSRRTFIKTQ